MSETHQNLPWVEKYRPKQLDDLISHQDIISTSKKYIAFIKKFTNVYTLQ